MEDWKEQPVLVVGGAGFLGSYLVDEWVEAGARVAALDNLRSGSWQRLAQHGGAVERIENDLRDDDFVDIVRRFKTVLNAAGIAPGLREREDYHQQLYEENLEIARTVRDASLAAGIDHYLEISSSCVYPDDAPVPTPEIALEGTKPEAVNLGYGQAKRQIETELIDSAQTHPSFHACLVRPFNLFGARDWGIGQSKHVIPSLIERFLEPGPEVVVWGDGTQTRSFVHARDAARAMRALLESAAPLQPYNIGRAEEISMRELAEAINKIGGFGKTICFDPNKPVGALRKACDPSRLLSQIPGFSFKFDTLRGLREMVDEAVCRIAR